jgi:hypothetical protein
METKQETTRIHKDNRTELFRLVYDKVTTNFFKTSSPVKTAVETNNDLILGFGVEEYRSAHITKHGNFIYDRASETMDDFLENYGNPLCGIYRVNNLLVVERNGDKVSIKLYGKTYRRMVGEKFFRKTTMMYFVTYRISTGDIYYGTISGYHLKKKSKKVVKRNAFYYTPIAKLYNDLLYCQITENKDLRYPADNERRKIVDKVFDIFFNEFGVSTMSIYTPDELIYKRYLDIRGIKYPDNWTAFSKQFPLPNKRQLKKNGFKLIDTFMSINGFSGDKIKKVLHNACHVNANNLRFSINKFGEDFLRQQDDKVLSKIIEYPHRPHESTNDVIPLGLNRNEKMNVLKCFMFIMDGTSDLITFNDHISFYNRLNKFETVKWKAHNLESFNREHILWSDKLVSYEKGEFFRFYSEEFTNRATQPIFNNENYYPVILTSTSEYNNESRVQSNCVRTYVKMAESLIISLRKDDVKSEQRATIEYRITKNKNRIEFRRVQALGKFNAMLDVNWMSVIRKLDARMGVLNNPLIFGLPEMVVKLKDTELYSKSGWSKGEMGNLIWLNDEVKYITNQHNEMIMF